MNKPLAANNRQESPLSPRQIPVLYHPSTKQNKGDGTTVIGQSFSAIITNNSFGDLNGVAFKHRRFLCVCRDSVFC